MRFTLFRLSKPKKFRYKAVFEAEGESNPAVVRRFDFRKEQKRKKDTQRKSGTNRLWLWLILLLIVLLVLLFY